MNDLHADSFDVRRGFERLVEIHGSERRAKAYLAWIIHRAEEAKCWAPGRRQILLSILRAAAA